MPGYRYQDHSHRDITEMTDQGDGSKCLTSLEDSIRAASFNKIVSQSNPPNSDDNSVEREDPDENQKHTQCEVLAHNRKFTVKQRSTEDALEVGRECSDGEKCYE